MKFRHCPAAIALLATAVLSLPAMAEIRWINNVYNYGAFDEDDGKAPCSFRFVNMGPEEIAIRNVTPQCGCTTASFTRGPIAPGDTGVINAVYNPVGRPGSFSKNIGIVFTDGTRDQVTLRGVVIGSSNTLRSRYPVEAGQMKMRGDQVSFGTIYKGHGKTSFFEIYNASQDSLPLTFSDVPAYVRVKPSIDPVPPGEQSVLAVTLSPGKDTLYGILTDSMNMALGDSPAVTVGLQAIVEEDFSTLTPGQQANAPQIRVVPDKVDFGRFDPAGGILEGEFTIENIGRSDLMLRRVYTMDPGITLNPSTTKIKRGKKGTVRVTVNPSALPSPLLNARVQVIANDPVSPLTLVRLVGEGAE